MHDEKLMKNQPSRKLNTSLGVTALLAQEIFIASWLLGSLHTHTSPKPLTPSQTTHQEHRDTPITSTPSLLPSCWCLCHVVLHTQAPSTSTPVTDRSQWGPRGGTNMLSLISWSLSSTQGLQPNTAESVGRGCQLLF